MTNADLQLVVAEAQELGFVGPGSIDAALRHAHGFAEGLPAPPGCFLDLGSGGGLPGLVLANLWPTANVVLLDSNRKRCAFLRDAVDQLGLGDRATVQQARAEEAGRDSQLRGRHDLVVARSFARPAVTAECAAPFLRPGGRLVVSEPPASDDAATRWSDVGLAELGLRHDHSWVSVGPAHFSAFVQAELCPDRFPRRVGIPAKRPLF